MCSSMCAVPGPASRVHVEIARLVKLRYLISFVNGKTSVSLPKSRLFLKATNQVTIPKHWGSLKVMTRKPTHSLRSVPLACGNKGSDKKEDTAPSSAQTVLICGLFIRKNFLADITIAAFELFVHGANSLCNAYHSIIWFAN